MILMLKDNLIYTEHHVNELKDNNLICKIDLQFQEKKPLKLKYKVNEGNFTNIDDLEFNLNLKNITNPGFLSIKAIYQNSEEYFTTVNKILFY